MKEILNEWQKSGEWLHKLFKISMSAFQNILFQNDDSQKMLFGA